MNELMIPSSNSVLEDSKASGNYLPTLNLHSKASSKNDDPEFMKLVNHIVLIEGGNYADLNESVDVICLGIRLKATYYNMNTKSYSSVYTAVQGGSSDATYKLWKQRAGDQNTPGYKYGPEYLLYVPELNKFCTYFCGTSADRKHCGAKITEMTNSKTAPHFNFTLRKFHYNGQLVKFPRYILESVRCDLDLPLPDEEDAQSAADIFLNPPAFVEDPGDDRS